MENSIFQSPGTIATMVGAVLACLALWVSLKKANVHRLIKDINRRFESGYDPEDIMGLFDSLPLFELWDANSYREIDAWVSNSIADGDSLKRCFRAIRSRISNRKKQEAVMGLFLGSMKKTLSLEELALIYADCLSRNNADDYQAGKTLIISLVVEEHLNGDCSEYGSRFRREVLKILSDSIASATDERKRVMLRERRIAFENYRLPKEADIDLNKLNF